MRHFILLLFGIAPVLPAHAAPWVDAYLEGEKHLTAGRWEAAVSAFDQAIAGKAPTGKRVRTYGMAFIDYFPYRGKGIALNNLGRWPEAIEALEKSVARTGVEPYLATARAGLRVALKPPPPRVVIKPPPVKKEKTPPVEPPIIKPTLKKWWEYYERGLKYAQDQRWPSAVADFQAAIKRRSEPTRLARIDGMGVLRYFPFRELGVVYYQSSQHDQALTHLRKSLEKAPTAKAAYYHNLAQGVLLRKAPPDKGKPRIQLERSKAGRVVRDRRFTVRGSARSENRVAAILINGRPLPMDVAKKKVDFSHDVTLKPGTNRIRIAVRDLVGRESLKSLSVTVEQQGPTVTLRRLRRLADGHVELRGFAYDETRLGSLQIEQRPVPLIDSVASPFTKRLAGGVKSLTILAVDATGNTMKSKITIADLLAGPAPTAWPSFVSAAQAAASPLSIRVEPLPSEVKAATVPLSWVIATEAGLKTVRLNEIERPIRKADAAAKLHMFSHTLNLRPGTNEIRLTATDRKGRRTTKTLSVKRIPDRSVTVALIPLRYQGKVLKRESSSLTALQAAVAATERFRSIPSSRRKLRRPLTSNLKVDKPAVRKLGKALGVDALLVTVEENVRNVEIYGQLISANNAKVLATADVFAPKRTQNSVKEKMRELVHRLSAY